MKQKVVNTQKLLTMLDIQNEAKSKKRSEVRDELAASFIKLNIDDELADKIILQVSEKLVEEIDNVIIFLEQFIDEIDVPGEINMEV